MNNQFPENRDISVSGALQVNSIFYTIQGEGIFSGMPAVFIRLAGCNLQCPDCDTEYTKRSLMPVSAILDKIHQLHKDLPADITKRRLIVITGGEPFRQNLVPLTDILISSGYLVQIETNGTLFQELNRNVYIICSPKTGEINKKLKEHIYAYKYVVNSDSVDIDGLPLVALGHPNSGSVFKAPQGSLVYIQPEDSKSVHQNNLNLDVAKRSVMRHNYILCIQVHKLIGVE